MSQAPTPASDLQRDFGDTAAEYAAARQAAALFDRRDRAGVRVTGADRAAWLHNVLTNTITTLDDGRGCYAFAVDVKGRVQFDMNVLNLGEALWLDVSRGDCDRLVQHLDRYLFTEDVQIERVRDRYAQLASAGPAADEVAAAIGTAEPGTLTPLDVRPLPDDDGWVFRHDLTGELGFELIVPAERFATWWQRLADHGARPAGQRALDALRIEAGIPWPGRELDGTVLPAETGQAPRAVAEAKGCYLGHEIIERMRSRGVVARQLVRLSLADGRGVDPPVELQQNGRACGRLTSLVPHPRGGTWIGLGYLKTGRPDSGEIVIAGISPPRAVKIDVQ